MLNDLQKQAAQAIVNIFETGRPRGEYGRVTLLAGDTGHLTYGRAQTTLASGNLHLLIKAYCAADGALHAAALATFLDRLEAIDLALDDAAALHEALRAAGDDPVMQAEQDAFFDRVYWAPALRSADYIGAESALGTAIVYDSRIHGSWHAIRDRTIAQDGALAALGEEAWFARYVETRRDWLANHANALLRRTVYRMESFAGLMAEENWALALPFTVRGMRIDADTLRADEPVTAWAGEAADRVLKLRDPRMEGDDVRAIQRALADAGIAAEPDGVFGPATDAAVRGYQEREGLLADGIVGPATRSALLP